MKIDFVSDLHYDCWPFKRWSWLDTQQSDSIIIAGDIADSLNDVAHGLDKIADVYKHVYFRWRLYTLFTNMFTFAGECTQCLQTCLQTYCFTTLLVYYFFYFVLKKYFYFKF